MNYKTDSLIRFSLLYLALTTLSGCGTQDINTSDPESVAVAVVRAVANKDIAQLEKLTLPEARKELKDEISENGFPTIQTDLKIRTEITERTEDTATIRVLDTDLLFIMKYQDNQWWFER